MKYEYATFLIHIDRVVQVEVSIRGCANDRASMTLQELQDAGKTVTSIGKALRTIQKRIDTQRGRLASEHAA